MKRYFNATLNITGWLLVLLGRFSTQSCLTTLMMLFLSGVVPGTFLAP